MNQPFTLASPPSNWRLLKLLAREQLSLRRLHRKPEPAVIMNEKESVSAFDEAGEDTGPLRPVYHFNALAVSALLPQGGTYLDLGCGSGRFIAHLTRLRPDVHVIGLDLAEQMLQRGRRLMSRHGRPARVRLIRGDMTDFLPLCETKIDVAGSLYALHHLPTANHIVQCFEQLKILRERDGCGIWLFDFNRPRHRRTPSDFPRLFTSTTSDVFKEDTRNSLTAAFTTEEINTCWTQAALPKADHLQARWLPLYQCHRLPPLDLDVSSPINPIKGFGNTRQERDTFNFFVRAFHTIPLAE